MPVGQIVSRLNEVRPSKDVIYQMIEEYIDTMARLNANFQTT
jgi:NAD(P)H-dependent flavin oxidoreductase YrpB (nitropropane dioxygenase family)